MSLTRIGSIGINTGIAFAGVTTIVTLNTANDALSIGATVNVGTGITLGASGDIFATGVSTFSGNLKVGSGVTISPDGDGFYTGVVTATTFSGSGANITAINASNIGSGTVPTARLGSGTASSSTFLRGDSTFQTVNTDLVSDTSPQLGGNLDVNTKNILFGDSSDGSSDDVLKFGAGNDLTIFHNGSASYIKDTGTGNLVLASSLLQITNAGVSENMAKFIENGAVELYHDNAKTLYTNTTGASIKGGNTGAETELKVYGNEGQRAILMLAADDGDDNADYWQFQARTDGNLNIQNYNGGSWVNSLILKGGGAAELYYNNVKTFHTKDNGVVIEGTEGANAILELRADEGDDNADYFRLHNEGGFLSFQDYGGGSWQTGLSLQQQNQVRLYYNGSEKLNTSSQGVSISGKIYMNNGNLQFGASGNGVDFSATSDASGSTSELLDDYEEGTWTPTCNQGTLAYGHNSYTKIGRMCYITTFVNTFSDRTSSSAIEITGLPYNPANESDCGACVFYRVADTDEAQIAARTSNSANGILFLVSSQGGSESWHHLTHSDLNHSNSQIKFSIWYAVA